MIAEPRRYAVQGRSWTEQDRVAYVLEHMAENKAYLHARDEAAGDADGSLLEQFRQRFRWYRDGWRALPRQAMQNGTAAPVHPPLCIDIETAAVCDLACPFCFRQLVATPDKIIDPDLCFAVIDQAAALGVPSIKFNWRGEPLLHPRLPDFVAHAKKRGILECIVNTNATKLDEAMARRLIESGIDLMIYSFDGGSKESYERMRPGRFQANSFDDVYANIRRFAAIRAEMGAAFPVTRIQMILTEETFGERDSFFELFTPYVDDVALKQYTERGGGISDLDGATRDRFASACATLGLPEQSPYMREGDGALFVATGRMPCEQPFQRLLVTYDGRVGMCCYDWGAQHPVGYVSDMAIANGESEYDKVMEKIQGGAKGFEAMAKVVKPKNYGAAPLAIDTLADIWRGSEITGVRQSHCDGNLEDVEICRACPFKETYRWTRIEEDSP